MTHEKKTLSFERTVKAEPGVVYDAFTNATTLREFLCNVATVNPKIGGRIYMAWDNSYYVAGEYTQLEENRAVAFSWQGKGDPAPTSIEVTLEAVAGGTHVHLNHSGLGEGETWQASSQEFSKGWIQGLENLASVLETGEDIRITRRPMMGILYAELNAEIAKEIGVPVSEGVRLGGVVEGLSAQSSGLQKNDVLVELDGKALKDWPDLGPILQSKRAGDTLETIYYRGEKRSQIRLTLAKRPLPEIPWTAEELAARVQQQYTASLADLDRAFTAISEAEASHKPGPEQWCAKEVLVHLITGEHFTQNFILEMLGGQERWLDGYPGNENILIQGYLAAFPTLQDMLVELKRMYTVNIQMAKALPADFFQKRKGSYWRLAYNWLQPDYHFQEHLGQIKMAIASAKVIAKTLARSGNSSRKTILYYLIYGLTPNSFH